MKKLAITLFLVLICIISTFAQETESKVAGIDFNAFNIEDNGIIELIKADKKLKTEIQPFTKDYDEMILKFEKLRKEYARTDRIEPWENCFINLEEKRNELNLLRDEIKKRENVLKLLYEKKEKEIVQPVNEKIEKLLKSYIKKNGYALLIDTSKPNNSAIIEEEVTDITKEFIDFYNSSNN